MKLIFLTILFFNINSFANCGDDFCNVKIVEVYDGDTFFVKLPRLHKILRDRMGIRVYGVDTPEIRTKSSYEKAMGIKAKEFVIESLLKAKRVDLKRCKRGKYFRFVCHVFFDDKSLADELIKNNLGVPSTK